MMGTLLYTLGLLCQLLLALLAVATSLLERTKLKGWVLASKDVDTAVAAAKSLPEPHRQIATEMAESVRVRSTLDDALVKAVVRAADEPWRPPSIVQAALHMALVGLAVGPAAWALFDAAGALAHSHAYLGPLHDAARYLEAPPRLAQTYARVREGFGQSAVLLAGLALSWSLAWWLRRPQVREALLVKSLLEVATRIRPGTAAPVGGRLAGLVAPERDLVRPAAATALWVGAVTAAWGVLYGTADVRASNHRDVRVAVWPRDARDEVSVRPDIVSPTTRGGQPFVLRGTSEALRNAPTVTVGPVQVNFQSRLLGQLRDGALSTELVEPDAALRARLDKASQVKLLAHRDSDVQEALLPTLRWLARHGDIRTFHMLVLRELPDGVAQADLTLTLDADDKGPAFNLRVEPEVTVVGAAPVPRTRATWRQEIAAAVRRLEPLYGASDRQRVRVEVAEAVTVGRLVEALGAADDSCPTDIECGLPGLGLRFVLKAR